jgi:phosphatidate cytidylyltransferase
MPFIRKVLCAKTEKGNDAVMSETAKRIVSGFSIAIVVILALYHYRLAASLHAFLLISAFALLGVEEFYRLTDRGLDGRPIRSIGFIFTVLFLLIFYFDYLTGYDASSLPAWVLLILSVFKQVHNPVVPVLLLFIIIASSYSMVYRPLDGTAYTIATTVTGPIYAAIPLAIVLSILSLDEGVFVFVYTALATIMTDVGAYFAGRWFGKHNAGLKVSPKKTYEGYAGGFIFANLVVQTFVYFWLDFYPETNRSYVPGWLESVLLTLVMSLISVFGDLVESALKRDARIKDSSSTIPGHGGVLDLVDAMLFTFPAGFYYFAVRAMIVSL